LKPADVAADLRLADAALAAGYRLVVHREIGSTNDEAMAAARTGDPGNLWIVAEQQTKGRGRQGRQWTSPPGNLYSSLLLIDPASPQRAPELGFVAGVALAHTLRPLVSRDARVRIKWPNDIVFEGAKLAGILLESMRLPDGRLACVIGIGVNCLSSPKDLPYRTAAVSDLVSMPITPADVLLGLSTQMVEWCKVWASGAGFAQIRSEWLALAAGIGTKIKVALPTRVLEGTFQTIDAAGRLMLDSDGAALAVEAGDVFFVERPKGSRAGYND
jgi:BirA family transcriptional regulator, biotin operon repressor / biotin---[acetyl-CoA-carboxylase] ligase